MNKFGFLSFFFTIALFLFQFIPIGINIGSEGQICSWIPMFFDININPIVRSFVHISVEIFNYQGIQVFLWGSISNGTHHLWIGINLMTFIFLFILSPLTAILALIGCLKENEVGRKFVIANYFLLKTIFLYCIIGIPLNSVQILGSQVEFSEVFFYIGNGFYILLLNLFIALIGISKHPIK